MEQVEAAYRVRNLGENSTGAEQTIPPLPEAWPITPA
jgi:hypothetical protein